MGHPVAAIPVSAAGVIADGPCVLAGFSIRNTHGTNAGVFRIYDNATTNSGTILWSSNFAAGVGDSVVLPGDGIQAHKGLFLHITNSATVEGSVHIN